MCRVKAAFGDSYFLANILVQNFFVSLGCLLDQVFRAEICELFEALQLDIDHRPTCTLFWNHGKNKSNLNIKYKRPQTSLIWKRVKPITLSITRQKEEIQKLEENQRYYVGPWRWVYRNARPFITYIITRFLERKGTSTTFEIIWSSCFMFLSYF